MTARISDEQLLKLFTDLPKVSELVQRQVVMMIATGRERVGNIEPAEAARLMEKMYAEPLVGLASDLGARIAVASIISLLREQGVIDFDVETLKGRTGVSS